MTRLEIAVQDTGAVQLGERSGELGGDRERLRDR
jgi:hypothetical protein